MTVRVRRRGLAFLALLAGASLLRSSLAISAPRPHATRSVLRLARTVGDPSRDVWAVESAPAKNWAQADAPQAPSADWCRASQRSVACSMRPSRPLSAQGGSFAKSLITPSMVRPLPSQTKQG